MYGANLGHCNGSAINYPVLSEIEWDDVTCLCVNVLYMFVNLRMFCRKYLHPLGTCMLFIFLSFFHFCTHFVPNISMPNPKCLRMIVPPRVCLCVYAARLGKGYRITAVFCLWEVALCSFPFVVPTDLSFCSGEFWEAKPGTFCISLLWQIVTNCQPYINRLRRI